MKKCPFCAEEIQDEAVKCKHCAEFLDESKRPASHAPPALPAKNPLPWYFRKAWIIIVVLSIPPFGIPMVLLNPSISRLWKIINTILILILSWLVWVSLVKTWELFHHALELMEEIKLENQL